MSSEKLEISDICIELRKLVAANVLMQPALDACTQAAYLIEKMRELALSGDADESIVEGLKWMLVEQGEG